MPPKPHKKPVKPPAPAARDHVLDAALSLAAAQGWKLTTIRDIADEAKVSLGEFYDLFEDKNALLPAYGRRLDRKVFDAFETVHPETPVRDVIFDILMERFDVAVHDKDALKSILDSFKTDPRQALMAIPQLAGSMARMLELAGIDTNGAKGAARIAGLTGVAVWVTRTWLTDDSRDLSKTMSALDKALSRIENLADKFNL